MIQDGPKVSRKLCLSPGKKELGIFIGRMRNSIVNDWIVCPVVNVGNVPKTIKEGTIIGSVTMFEETINEYPEKKEPVVNDHCPGSEIKLDNADLTDAEKRSIRDLVNEFKDIVAK